MKKLLIILSSMLCLICSCSQKETIETISKAELLQLTEKWKEPKMAIWYYKGSDNEFHYFRFIDLGLKKDYRINRTEWDLDFIYPLKKNRKEWRVMMWGPHKNTKNYTVYSALEMSSRNPEEAELKRIIQVLTDRINNGDKNEHLIRGFFYLLLHDTNSRALEDFKFSLEIDSTNSNAYLGLGIYYLFKNQDTSLLYFNKAIQFDKKNAFAYFYRASVQSDKESELIDLNKAIELKPDYAMFYTWRGTFYERNDSIELAIKDWTESIKFDKKILLNYALLGLTYEIQENYKEALNNYSLLIKVAPHKPTGYENRGELYHKLKLYHKSIEDYKKVLEFIGKTDVSYNSGYYNYKIAINYYLLKNDSTYIYLEKTFKEDSNYINKVLEEEIYFNSIKQSKQFNNLIKKYRVNK